MACRLDCFEYTSGDNIRLAYNDCVVKSDDFVDEAD
jgi:hypothetical protein